MTNQTNIVEIKNVTLAERINTFINTYGYTINQLGVKSGVHPETLESMLLGNKADESDWIKVETFLDKINSTVYPTKLLRVIHRMLDTLYEEKGIGVVTGNSGAGKTEACRQYCLLNPDAVYIRVTEVFTTKYMLTVMLQSLGGSVSRMNRQQLYETLNHQLSNKQRIFIVDEAERLQVQQLECLRDLFDQSNVALCFVGLDKLRTLMKTGNSLKEDLVQLYSRISYNKGVDILEPEDVRMILDDKLSGNVITAEKTKKLSRSFHNKGGIRAMFKLCNIMEKLMEKNKGELKEYNDALVELAVNKLSL